MTPEQIDQLGTDVGSKIPEIIGDLAPHIREAASAVLDETQDSEKAPKLNISFAVTLNLAAHPPTYDIKGSVSVKRTAKMEGELEDADQIKLTLN